MLKRLLSGSPLTAWSQQCRIYTTFQYGGSQPANKHLSFSIYFCTPYKDPGKHPH